MCRGETGGETLHRDAMRRENVGENLHGQTLHRQTLLQAGRCFGVREPRDGSVVGALSPQGSDVTAM